MKNSRERETEGVRMMVRSGRRRHKRGKTSIIQYGGRARGREILFARVGSQAGLTDQKLQIKVEMWGLGCSSLHLAR